MRQLLPERLYTLARASGNGHRLPQRVNALIAAQEAQSERLICWVQLSVAATFTALYLLAPRPVDAGMAMFQPVPIALAAYGLFTLARLLLAVRGFMPAWLLVVSIISDMVMLLGLIWAFHLQYGQPAAFSLKVPTFIYVFVFIALRALRFDHRFVLSAGLLAALGWLLLVVAAVNASPPDTVTRSFIGYINDSKILIGAEFDKVFTILMVTGILTFAVWRARRMLVTAVREEAAGREIKRFLSEGVAEAIAGADSVVEAGTAVERTAAIVMLDIRGFTKFSTTVPPTTVVAMLTAFHARAIPILKRHGGVIDKFLGDGLMATFGAVHPSQTAAADALAALDELMADAGDWTASLGTHETVPLQVNGAMAAGPVVFATLGNASRLEYTVIGEAVNLAAKLEKHNKLEGTRALTTAASFELAVAQGFVPRAVYQRRQARPVSGVPEPLDLLVIA